MVRKCRIMVADRFYEKAAAAAGDARHFNSDLALAPPNSRPAERARQFRDFCQACARLYLELGRAVDPRPTELPPAERHREETT